jgi:hypothetical protein
VLGVPASHRVAFAVIFKELACVFVNRLQHPEASVGMPQQVLVDERLQRV